MNGHLNTAGTESQELLSAQTWTPQQSLSGAGSLEAYLRLLLNTQCWIHMERPRSHGNWSLMSADDGGNRNIPAIRDKAKAGRWFCFSLRLQLGPPIRRCPCPRGWVFPYQSSHSPMDTPSQTQPEMCLLGDSKPYHHTSASVCS